jgi:dihydrofolate synthase/folylpolyglutamate synthase
MPSILPRFTQLPDWLAWLETLHPKSIDLGLSRVYQVAKALDLIADPSSISHEYSGALAINNVHTFVVAGTNGKGSCVATIEQMLCAQNLRVGSYTSPHLHHYCERIRIDGAPVNESFVCSAFAAIDHVRGDISLTYFEFSTLAALWIFAEEKVPYIVLEVGLGGRLDAVNIVDADIAIVTSIAVDHEEWLGSDREVIALEKLGVTRCNKPVVIAETVLTKSLNCFIADKKAQNNGSHPIDNRVSVINQHFAAIPSADNTSWQWQTNGDHYVLPLPSLPLESVAAALEALHISGLLPELDDMSLVKMTLSQLHLAGRYQVINVAQRTVVFDVAHNPAASAMLSYRLQRSLPNEDGGKAGSKKGRVFAVFAVMADKDIPAIIASLSGVFDCWFVGSLQDNERSVSMHKLGVLLQESNQRYSASDTIEQAFDDALSQSSEHDRIVVFGSFFTVAALQNHITVSLS